MKISEQIARQRKCKGMTQETLSELSGISLRTIQRIENGRSVPRAYTLKILCGCLEMEPVADTAPAAVDGAPAPALALSQINSAGLTALLLPVLPVIISLLIWLRNNKDQTIRAIAKPMISFQILWLLLTGFVLAATQIMYYYFTGSHISGRIPPLLPAYLLMLAGNAAVVIGSASGVQKGEPGLYRFIPVVF